jgi:hypothetical protein
MFATKIYKIKTTNKMAIFNFVKPDKIVLQKANDFEAQFEFRPLEPGYGVTIGNALRRVLLNSLGRVMQLLVSTLPELIMSLQP